ncbi:MAG TPA: HDOD domain-containing protein [Planctomycetota bacterium]|nr:HDOD domain-containing protein [Planctomycetota bacterium]
MANLDRSTTVHGARTAVLTASLRERAARGAFEVPALPAVALEVLSTTAGADADLRRLVALLHRDPALAGNVLKVANSSLYAPREPIASLPQAVSRLGFETVRDIASAVAVKSSAFAAPAGFRERVEQDWRRAVLTAQFAREIARSRRRNVESAFLSGLLHDVGRVLALRALAASGDADVPAADVDAVCDAVQTELGLALVAAWNLPPQIGEAVAFHRDLAAAPAESDIAATVALARRFAEAWRKGADQDATSFVGDPAATALNLYPDDVAALWDRRAQIAAAAEASS